MNRKQVDAIIKKHLPLLLRKYGISDWEVEIVYLRHPDADYMAAVKVHETYRQAVIFFNTAYLRRYASEGDVLEVLEHEVQHILLHPLEALRGVVLDTLGNNKLALKVVDGEFDRTAERLRVMVGQLAKRLEGGGGDGSSD